MSALWMRAAVLLAVAGGVAACGTPPVPGLPPGTTYVLGGVLEGPDGKPLRFASVALSGSPLGTVANESGRFGIDGVRSGVYGLTVVHLGYRSEPAEISVPGSGAGRATLRFTRDPRLGPALADSVEAVVVSYELRPAGGP